MGKRGNPMSVKSALAYDIGEAAKALGVTPATIHSWIKDGLPVMSARKPYLILGDSLKSYLRAKRKASKRPLSSDQLYCRSCRAGRRPTQRAAILTAISPRTHLLKGVCSECSGCCTRMISVHDVSAYEVRFNISKGASGEP